MFTMLPPPVVRRWGTACLVHRNTAVVLTAITRSHSPRGNSWVGAFRPATPALLTSTSSRPWRATTSAKAPATASSSHPYQVGCWTPSVRSAMIHDDDHPGVPDAGHAGAAARGAGVVGRVQMGRHPRDRR